MKETVLSSSSKLDLSHYVSMFLLPSCHRILCWMNSNECKNKITPAITPVMPSIHSLFSFTSQLAVNHSHQVKLCPKILENFYILDAKSCEILAVTGIGATLFDWRFHTKVKLCICETCEKEKCIAMFKICKLQK